MRFVLALGRARTRCAALSIEWKRLTAIWDLAERHHPEEVWWAAIYLGGARTLDDLHERAPRNDLAPQLASHSEMPVVGWSLPAFATGSASVA